MELDLRLIRHAQALAAHQSFSRAAAELGIAQPTLSRSIRDLEERVGLPLFVRGPRGAQPTDFGRMFLAQSTQIVEQIGDLERDVALARGLKTGEVAVGMGPYAAEALAPACLRRFTASHPTVRLRIHVDAPDALVRVLNARSVDFVVAESTLLEDDDGVDVLERLPPIQGHVIARTRHPLASRSGITFADVLEYPFVQIARMPPRLLKPLLASRQRSAAGQERPPFPAVECTTVPLAINAVLDSDATMIASLGMVHTELERGLLRPILCEPWLCSSWAIIRLRGRTLGPAAAALIRELQRAHEQAVSRERTLQRAWARRTAGQRQVRSAKATG